jgi:ABC-type transport system involved in multi-copper enzyme maturation permease subunit
MSGSVVRRLIRKDLHLWRGHVIGALAAGGASLAIMPLTPVASYVGGVAFVCVLVILNIVLVMNGVVQERKDKVQLFILSLPVSTTQYTTAKVIANALAFTVPWAVLTAAALTMIVVSSMPDGLLPFWTVLLAYLLGYYLVLLAVALATDATGWHATAITIGNVSINLLIPLLLNLPSIGAQTRRAEAVWTGDVVGMAAGALLIGAGALALAIRRRASRADHA